MEDERKQLLVVASVMFGVLAGGSFSYDFGIKLLLLPLLFFIGVVILSLFREEGSCKKETE